jgi:hypothetical protein
MSLNRGGQPEARLRSKDLRLNTSAYKDTKSRLIGGLMRILSSDLRFIYFLKLTIKLCQGVQSKENIIVKVH